jgi:hypothetical protein
MGLSYSYDTSDDQQQRTTTTNNNNDNNTIFYYIAMELDLSQWTLAPPSSHSSSSDELSLQSNRIVMDQESLTQNGIDGAEILNGFRSFVSTGSHLPIDIVDVPPLAARP